MASFFPRFLGRRIGGASSFFLVSCRRKSPYIPFSPPSFSEASAGCFFKVFVACLLWLLATCQRQNRLILLESFIFEFCVRSHYMKLIALTVLDVDLIIIQIRFHTCNSFFIKIKGNEGLQAYLIPSQKRCRNLHDLEKAGLEREDSSLQLVSSLFNPQRR